jgi:hypothetical protein
MSRDEILDEVRAIRDCIAREHDYDLESIFRMLEQAEVESGRPHVVLPPRPVAPATIASRAGDLGDGAVPHK